MQRREEPDKVTVYCSQGNQKQNIKQRSLKIIRRWLGQRKARGEKSVSRKKRSCPSPAGGFCNCRSASFECSKKVFRNRGNAVPDALMRCSTSIHTTFACARLGLFWNVKMRMHACTPAAGEVRITTSGYLVVAQKNAGGRGGGLHIVAAYWGVAKLL
jgi:hypothetical protein